MDQETLQRGSHHINLIEKTKSNSDSRLVQSTSPNYVKPSNFLLQISIANAIFFQLTVETQFNVLFTAHYAAL